MKRCFKLFSVLLITILLFSVLPQIAKADGILYEYFNEGDDLGDYFFTPTWQAQTFTANSTHLISSLKFKVSRSGSPGTITWHIRNTSGGVPSGSDLDSGTFDGNSLSAFPDSAWQTVNLTSPMTITNGEIYALILSGGTNGSNTIGWREDSTSSTYGGGAKFGSFNSGTTWSTSANMDFLFEVYGDLTVPDLPTVTSVSAVRSSSGTSAVLTANVTWSENITYANAATGFYVTTQSGVYNHAYGGTPSSVNSTTQFYAYPDNLIPSQIYYVVPFLVMDGGFSTVYGDELIMSVTGSGTDVSPPVVTTIGGSANNNDTFTLAGLINTNLGYTVDAGFYYGNAADNLTYTLHSINANNLGYFTSTLSASSPIDWHSTDLYFQAFAQNQGSLNDGIGLGVVKSISSSVWGAYTTILTDLSAEVSTGIYDFAAITTNARLSQIGIYPVYGVAFELSKTITPLLDTLRLEKYESWPGGTGSFSNTFQGLDWNETYYWIAGYADLSSGASTWHWSDVQTIETGTADVVAPDGIDFKVKNLSQWVTMIARAQGMDNYFGHWGFLLETMLVILLLFGTVMIALLYYHVDEAVIKIVAWLLLVAELIDIGAFIFTGWLGIWPPIFLGAGLVIILMILMALFSNKGSND